MDVRLPLVAALLWTPAASRPTLPEPPLGTASASFAGGGTAHGAGVSSLFDNPAALSVPDAFQAEAGLMGFSAGFSPYFLYGAPAGERGSYALGYWYDARPGNPESPAAARQGLVLGVSREAFPWASVGAAVKSVGTGDGIGGNGFGIDADLGAMVRAWKAAWTGLTLHNAMESGVGQEPEGFRTHRVYGIAVGTGWPKLGLAGLTFREPDAYYELRAHGLPPYGRVAHTFSLASAFLPGGRLGFRGTLSLPQGGTPGFALGTFLNLPAGRAAIVAAYAFHAGGSEETGEAGACHSLSLNLRFGGRLDRLRPELEVSSDRARIGPGDSAAVHFRLSARDFAYAPGGTEGMESGPDEPGWAGRKPALAAGRAVVAGRIRAWGLIVREAGADGLAGRIVRAYRGRDLPPRVIRWDGDDEEGHPLRPGYYAFRLEAEDAAGNPAATVWQLIRIMAAEPAAAPAEP